MIFHGTPKLITERLILRPIEQNDFKSAYKNYCSRPNVARLLTWDVHINEEATKEFYESQIKQYNNPYFYCWVITLKNDPQNVIGCISSVKYDILADEIEIGYCLGDDFWHQGIMSESFAAVIKYLFESEDFRKIYACYLEENPHSGGVMRKCGLKYVRTERTFYKKLNKDINMIYMDLSKIDYLRK
jgi:[ribosomal protein S5]-alanine N-acetyltransferase